jgi:hypothetical protein
MTENPKTAICAARSEDRHQTELSGCHHKHHDPTGKKVTGNDQTLNTMTCSNFPQPITSMPGF